MKIDEIIDIRRTVATSLFNDINYIWEVLPKIEDNIINIASSLDKDKYTMISDNIWVGSNTKINKLATIIPPCIIGANTEIRPGAYLRGNVIIGDNCVIGNSTEIKNSIIFDNSEVPHFNYVGDSILGYHSHLGAGVILSNLKNDGSNIVIRNIDTGMMKLGSIIGNNTNIGSNSVLYPGTIVGSNTSIYPLTRVRGIIPSNSIMKDEENIIEKE